MMIVLISFKLKLEYPNLPSACHVRLICAKLIGNSSHIFSFDVTEIYLLHVTASILMKTDKKPFQRL